MISNILSVLAAMIVASTSAQVTKEYKSHLGDIVKVTGHQTFSVTPEFRNDEYYIIKDGNLYVYSVNLMENGALFSHKTQEVALSGLNFKQYNISDMNSGSTLAFTGWMLIIYTKKKVECISSMDTFIGAPGVDKMNYVGLLFTTKEEAQKTYDKIKAAAEGK